MWKIPFLHINLYALLVFVVSGVLTAALTSLMPFLGGPRESATLSTVLFFVAAFAERKGIKARALWMPVWFLAGIAASINLFSLGGGWIVLGVLGAIATVLAGLAALGTSAEKDEWEAAPAALLAAKDAALFDDGPKMWKELSKALVLPAGTTYTPEQVAHMNQAVSFLRERGGGWTEPQRIALDSFAAELRHAAEFGGQLLLSDQAKQAATTVRKAVVAAAEKSN